MGIPQLRTRRCLLTLETPVGGKRPVVRLSAEMETPVQPLTPREHERLVGIIEREAPELLDIARDAVNIRWLTDDEAGALNRVLLDVFLRSLDQDDEPSRERVEADGLLGSVEMQRRGYWER